MFCGEETLIGAGPDDLCIKPLLCKCWHCETCLPHRLKQLRALAASGEPDKFITFTVDPSRYTDPSDAANDLVKCWRAVRQRMTREGKAPHVAFLAVIEATKRGWPHLHILARMPYVSQAWLSAAADRSIGAPIVDIRKVYNRRHASRYIAKYVSKGPAHYKGCKRYWRSQDYAGPAVKHRPVADANRTWWRERTDCEYLAWTLRNCGWVHGNDPTTAVLLRPTPEARWLWAHVDPPEKLEVRPWRPLDLNTDDRTAPRSTRPSPATSSPSY